MANIEIEKLMESSFRIRNLTILCSYATISSNTCEGAKMIYPQDF
ncbi:hypothetical protein BVG79_01068 [Ketogulonicigenium robustum]|uniref:Uncharacterized protein n=1 Tax=Ketogulonicigenium robustum TaxID=92947 RepID=A0A1W6NYX3_9RHOB|nr:hypothetical protein BVG79_01068 [Ketogulonicigenium robustum]